jgi:hypothetical protein
MDAYTARGGAAVVGKPLGQMQNVSGGWFQRFAGGSGGLGMLTRDGAPNDTVRWVNDAFLNAYDAAGGPGGPLRYPVSDRFEDPSGVERQNTANGLLAANGESAAARVYGDVDGNASVTMGDADAALAFALGAGPLDEISALAADVSPSVAGGVTGDAQVDALDVVRILGTLSP